VEGILKGLRVIEGSAFVAAPLGGMTLAQSGADVIRFDQIGGGLDHKRWPVTLDGKQSLFWAGLNKGKRSIAVDFHKLRGKELLTQLICAPGENAGLFRSNFPAHSWLSYEAEVGRIFEKQRVTWAPYRTVREAIESDPDCSPDNPMFSMVEQPGIGIYLMPASPLDFGQAPRLPARPAPRLGEHTDEILLDILGLSEGEVGKLHDEGIVAGPELSPS
jgi:crotonobetainyl-CoA:carnitine CoA-transferase CaiB-like acyl-CoA transferase